MREFVLAMRAIWSAWSTGEKLDFRGEFYTHTLMTPFFSPGPNPYGPPKVMMAAVGDKMTEVAGEVADGMILHPFTTEKYVRDVTLPGLQRGFSAAGKTRADFTLALPLFVVTGTTDDEWAAARKGTREQIAFYGSTPGYHGVLRLHGWEDVGAELNQLSRRGEWVAMGELITDEMLETFAVVAPPGDIAAGIVARYGDVLDRVSFDTPYASDPAVWTQLVADLRDAR
jgi:probable F420-dependent oxidoreductase